MRPARLDAGEDIAVQCRRTKRRALRKQSLHDFAFNIRQPEVAALKTIGEFRVIEAEQMQKRGVQIVDMDFVLHDVKTEFVGFAQRDARL